MIALDAGLPDLPEGEKVHSVQYAAFTRRIAVGTTLGRAFVYDNTGRETMLVQTIESRSPSTIQPSPATVLWAPSGDILLVLTHSGTVDLYNRRGVSTSTQNSNDPYHRGPPGQYGASHLVTATNNDPYQLSWSNHGLSGPLTTAKFLPITPEETQQAPQSQDTRGFGGRGQTQVVKYEPLSFVYAGQDGALTTVYVDTTTNTWATKKIEKVHVLGVTAIAFGDNINGGLQIWTGGMDGYCRMGAINYRGEVIQSFVDYRCLSEGIVKIEVIDASKPSVALLGLSGSLAFFTADESGALKPGQHFRNEHVAHLARDLTYLKERKVLCAVLNGGKIISYQRDQVTNSFTKLGTADALGGAW